MTTMLPAEAEHLYAVADLEAMPDDGHRYELIDGALLVTPAPGWPHQSAVLRLTVLLDAACPQELRVLSAPFAVRPDGFNEYQPDVLVARYVDLDLRCLPKAPVLAVEVLSPSSGIRDSTLKKGVYARLGVPSFWLVDPHPDRPSLTAFELDGDEYRQVAQVEGAQIWKAQRPFAVEIAPAALVAGLHP